MKQTSIKVLAITAISAGILALAPSLARAFHGNLVTCIPATGIPLPVPIKPGLTCTDAVQKIKVTATGKKGAQLGGCNVNGSAPWTTWVTDKVFKYAGTPNLKTADVTLKAVTYGNCDFLSPSANATAISGGGQITFYSDDPGVTKVKGAKSSFFVAPKAAGGGFLASGLITKGLGVGGTFESSLAIDTSTCGSDPACQGILGCATGHCPGTYPIGTQFDLTTDSTSYVKLYYPSNQDCVGALDPLSCCTGSCSALHPGTPEDCGDDPAVGTCGS